MQMNKRAVSLKKAVIRTLHLGLGTSLLALGCSDAAEHGTETSDRDVQAIDKLAQSTDGPGESIPLDKLPTIEPLAAVTTFIQQLPEPTARGENVAVHVKLPPPSNENLKGSLVRVLGDAENPLVVFSSDALVKLGRLKTSPGPEFFTTFLTLDPSEIGQRLETEKLLSSGQETTKTTLVFRGRTPVAITSGVAFDRDVFDRGGLVALGICPIRPASVLARWQESLMITDPLVVRDAGRTNDACLGGGNPNGVWTFKHLMGQMAIGSGLSTHDFVLRWLRMWLNSYTVNGDTLPARTQMFTRVIRPWATASGVTATLTNIFGVNVLSLSGPLNLDRAPFRLSAIVNRIDLGGTASGPAGYGGGTTSQPTDAGELRFVFGVQDLSTCTVLPFSVIAEYGVPIEGCENVRDWARKWIKLNNPAFAPRFTPAWRAHLETLTQSVVLHGAAPAKGNQSALNQLRTNEIALGFPWELREFKLATENVITDTDTAANGPLRAHTVAMTPNDTVFSPTPNPTVNAFVLSDVLSGVPPVVPTLPDDCSASYTVPGQFLGQPFRGGNSFTAPPTHWRANVNFFDNRQVCARHEFSFNTCNGCHFGDTSTSFLHVNPQTMPAALSNFLTGGPFGIWSVPDTQFGAPNWTFADLDRRFKRLYEISCSQCGRRAPFFPSFIDFIAELNGFVPIDPVGPVEDPRFKVGPVSDLRIANALFERRDAFLNTKLAQSVAVDGNLRPVEVMVH